MICPILFLSNLRRRCPAGRRTASTTSMRIPTATSAPTGARCPKRWRKPSHGLRVLPGNGRPVTSCPWMMAPDSELSDRYGFIVASGRMLFGNLPERNPSSRSGGLHGGAGAGPDGLPQSHCILQPVQTIECSGHASGFVAGDATLVARFLRCALRRIRSIPVFATDRRARLPGPLVAGRQPRRVGPRAPSCSTSAHALGTPPACCASAQRLRVPLLASQLPAGAEQASETLVFRR